MNKHMKMLSTALAFSLGASTLTGFVGCKKKDTKNKPDALVVMSDAVDGLFNPFFATTGADMEVVGMTQIGMLTTGYTGEGDNAQATVAFGDDEAVVVKDYEKTFDATEGKDGTSTYRFVIKNGITYSDGVPLTMNDVLFNMYVYLDPVYTGSSTMYSTDIVGLKAYRTQTELSGDGDDTVSEEAAQRAETRVQELVDVYTEIKDEDGAEADTSVTAIKNAIKEHVFSDGYKAAIAPEDKWEEMENANAQVWVNQLTADYDYTLETFKKELESDYNSAKDSYVDAPYFFDEYTAFLFAEGYVNVEYEKMTLANGRETDDKSKVKKVTNTLEGLNLNTKEKCINAVYERKVISNLDQILTYWATAQTVRTEYIAKATDVILHENLSDGELAVKNISGITSLGHEVEKGNSTQETVTVNGHEYKLATSHKADGTPTANDAYDVLQIKVNGTDPKAVWNFGFSVAPQHYYAPNQTVNIKEDKFGVQWGSFDFMKGEIQSARNVSVPVGAGAYRATDKNNSDTPSGSGFYSDNVIYFKAFDNFMLGAPKIGKLRYQVVASSDALNVLEQGSVHFVTPQFTKENSERIDKMSNADRVDTWQLGYGYIGVNAGKVEDINLRRAIMSAMNTKLSLDFYSTGNVKTIEYPMSTVSWAYPKNSHPNFNYLQWQGDEDAIEKIEYYTNLSGKSGNDLKMKFTIAGSALSEHPTYPVFKHAAELLNSCGWNVEVVPDVNALSKLSTGALTVWAAAWGSSIDPDMYQVYHKNSSATSTIAWGYREIKANPGKYAEETSIINDLSEKIDDGRSIDDQDTRTEIYKDAMELVLELAVEMPVYQRKVLYAYNSNVIKKASLPETVNPYTSPLSRIWEVEFAD